MSPSPKQQRVYSFTVSGWIWLKGEKNDHRQAQIVAVSNDEAIAEARELLDPGDGLPEWDVVTATELNPAEAKGWISWHKAATSPLGRADTEPTQD